MIGVIADPAERAIVREFFELFKTPWEFYRGDRRYDVLVCSGSGPVDDHAAELILIYGGCELASDAGQKSASEGRHELGRMLGYGKARIPIYGNSRTFHGEETGFLIDAETRLPAGFFKRSSRQACARIGYDLFHEIRVLLTAGQPAANAGIPTLDLHIALLRDLIVNQGVQLVEIPPAPEGYQFAACLTHDVDHPFLQKHRLDHTSLGFLWRAIFGSLLNVCRRRMPVRDLWQNWLAATKLPFIYLGLAKDFWAEFSDRYLEAEAGVPSTFFFIPFRNRPGRTLQGEAPSFRAAQYGAADLANTVRKLQRAGCEVGLHGIDAWLDDAAGSCELEELRRLTNADDLGVRMHWLYYGEHSPIALERAGAVYDSTVGYNDAVGYRAGTTQVYKPLEANRLLELPLHVMDTALFLPGRLGLSPKQAWTILHQIIDNAVDLGGCITINWHDRSLAPERLWGACYRELIQETRSRGAWLSTAGQVVAWFRKRRSATFQCDPTSQCGVRVTTAVRQTGDDLPGLQLRIHNAPASSGIGVYQTEGYTVMAVGDRAE